MSLQFARFDKLVSSVKSVEDSIISEVMTAGDYLPPHKSAGHVPYDAVLVLESSLWAAGDVEMELDERDLDYNHVISVTKNDSAKEGEALAFVSLVRR